MGKICSLLKLDPCTLFRVVFEDPPSGLIPRQNSSSPTIANPFPPPCPPRSLIVAQTLLRTSRRPTTADHLWLHVQILLSSGQVAETLTLLRREAGYGALARTWIRMRTVEIIAERMDGVEDVKALWEGEWDWVAGLFAKADGQEWVSFRYDR